MPFKITLAAAAALTLAACAGMPGAALPVFSQAGLPEAVQVPAGHQVALETVGTGQITYACRARKDAPEMLEWVFVGPEARLTDRAGQPAGRYFGPPATWAAADGSSITGTQLAVAPAGMGHIPLQLVRAHPAMGAGVLQGVSHIQRVATRGGVAPAAPCSAAQAGKTQTVPYQADYIFWRPARQ